MTELAKWAWILLLCFLYFGIWTFAIIAAVLVLFLVLNHFKPEWIDKLWS